MTAAEATARPHPKRAMDLNVGDVIIGPDGSRNRVTEWESFPHIAVCFRTDTGHDIEVKWLRAVDEYSYDIAPKD